MNSPLWMFVFALWAAPVFAQDALPRHANGEAMDFEPKLMLDGPQAGPAEATLGLPPDEQLKQAQADLDRARHRAAEGEELYKEGILAKIEEEGRQMRVVRAQKALADAQLAVAAANAGTAHKALAAKQGTQQQVDDADAALKGAQSAATAAAQDWEKAQLDAAKLDLERKRTLYREGASSRREVEMAQDKVMLLSGSAGQ